MPKPTKWSKSSGDKDADARLFVGAVHQFELRSAAPYGQGEVRAEKIRTPVCGSYHRAGCDPMGAISRGTADASFELLSVNDVFTLRTCGAAVSSAMKV